MDEAEREDVLWWLDRDEVDPEFLPYLDRINELPLVASMQCCIGHIKYEEGDGLGGGCSDCWGYLLLLLDMELGKWLNARIKRFAWLSVELSKLWDERAGQEPELTDGGACVLAFAWDARHWPRPADDICELSEEFHQMAGVGAGNE